MPVINPGKRLPPHTFNSIAFVGDSRVAAQFIDSGQTVKSNGFFFNVANALLGQRFKTVYNGGISGDRSDQYLANLPNAIASGASWLLIHGVANDIAQSGTTGDTALTIWARIKMAIIQALNSGINVIAVIEPGSTTVNTATLRGMVFQFNEYLREFAAVTPGVFLFDLPAIVMDPTNANIGFLSGYSNDGTHLSSAGAWYAGNAFASYIGGFVAPMASQIGSAAEIAANGNIQQLANPLFLTTTGGTSGTGITGSTPSGFSTLRGGSATATVSVGTDPSGFGNAVTIAGTFTSSSDNIQFKQDATLGNFTIPGDVIDSGVEIVVSSGAVNLTAAALWTNIGGTSNPNADLYSVDNNALPGVAMDVVLRSAPFALPSGASWVDWQVRFTAAGAGSFTALIRRPWLRRRFAV